MYCIGRVAAAAGLAALRGGRFYNEFRNSLWIIGCLMLLTTFFSSRPRRETLQVKSAESSLDDGTSGTDDRGGAVFTVVLALSAFGMFGIAYLVG